MYNYLSYNIFDTSKEADRAYLF